MTREKVTFGAVEAAPGDVLPAPETAGDAGVAVAAGVAGGDAAGDAAGVWERASAHERRRMRRNTGRTMDEREEAYGERRGMQCRGSGK